MDIIVNAISDGFWKSIADLASDGLKAAMNLIIEMVINLSDINKYMNIDEFLKYFYSIAAALLLVSIAKEGLKSQANIGKSRSISELTMRVIFAGTGIYALPWSVKNLFIPINNALMQLINSIGKEVTPDALKDLISKDIGSLGAFLIALMLVYTIGYIVFGIAAGMRYAELLIAIMMAPIIATSFIKGNEGIETWFKETTCIVFTQSIHVLLLKLLVMIAINTSGVVMIVLSTGIIAVGLKGPQIIRNYLYSSGVGSTSIGIVTGGVRMATMQKMMSATNPVAA